MAPGWGWSQISPQAKGCSVEEDTCGPVEVAGVGSLPGVRLPVWREEGASHQSQFSLQFFASMLTYPFVLVSNLMAVNNCG